MSERSDHGAIDDRREQIGDEFNRDSDPLAEYSEKFEQLSIDPFELYLDDVFQALGNTSSTETDYQRTFRQWRDHMEGTERHPACPTETHVKSFAYKYRDDAGNRPDTVDKKLLRLNRAYEYWQSDPNFPHPQDYNPFALARLKMDLSKPSVKEPPHIPLDTLRMHVQKILHLRDRLIVLAQLKLGVRAGEICNIQLQDLAIQNAELHNFYPGLGTHPMLEGRQNAVFIAPKPTDDLPVDGRSGNKSRRPRILPLDAELRQAFIRYLLVRPDTGDPWVFLSKKNHQQLGSEGVNKIWKNYFHPEYEETEQYRAVTSHFGRHRFTTYWRVEQDLNRDLIKYMRGDKVNKTSIDDKDVLDEYVHTYYDDIEPIYRERIFRLTQ